MTKEIVGIYTKIEKDLYEKIKKKGYKYPDLIRMGFEVMEYRDSFVRIMYQMLEKISQIISTEEEIINKLAKMEKRIEDSLNKK